MLRIKNGINYCNSPGLRTNDSSAKCVLVIQSYDGTVLCYHHYVINITYCSKKTILIALLLGTIEPNFFAATNIDTMIGYTVNNSVK